LKLLDWIKSLFSREPEKKKESIRVLPKASTQRTAQPAPAGDSRPKLAPKARQDIGDSTGKAAAMAQANAPGGQPEAGEEGYFPAPLLGVGNLDYDPGKVIAARIEEILQKVGARIDNGEYDLPNLPSTSMAILDLTADPSVEISRMTDTLEQDPVMSSELLKTANSVFYGGVHQAETVQQGVMRLGMRNLRSLIFALSMKSVIPRKRGLANYAEEIWRQAISMGKIARVLGPHVGMRSDNAFLLGLLQDIGKIALLDLLGKSTDSGVLINRALIGQLFKRYHERTGAAMAKKWNLPEEIVSVAGCHHDFLGNEAFPRPAAMASLVQKIDLYLSLGSKQEYWALLQSKELEILQFPYELCRECLKKCVEVYSSGTTELDPSAAEPAAG
jgi:HD-like signal output (HDOD) protein